jgi:predicted alpha/beta-fold hydrolase
VSSAEADSPQGFALESRTGGADPFHPAWWLPGPHAQTIWGRLARGRRLVRFRRESVATPDGDELLLDHVDGPSGSPRVLLLHGLEGSSYSVYAQGILREISRLGWRGVAMNFRSCARPPDDLSRMLPNRRPRLYHSGETSDLDFVTRMLAESDPAPLFAIGASLGGNVLLKWLGENPTQTRVAAAAAVSAPYDLAASARHLETPLGRLYVGGFLRTLRAKAVDTARRFPEAAEKIDLKRTLEARTFREFDDAATAPLHDFEGAEDYYRRSSCLGFLPAIRTRTLCVSAKDDPFLPRAALDRAREAAPEAVEFRVTRRGGHLGWVAGALPGRPRYWAERLLVRWLGKMKADGREPGSPVGRDSDVRIVSRTSSRPP